MAKDSISNGDALKANTAALAAHTQALNQSTAALVAHAAALTPSTVKQFVYGVLGAPLTLPDTTTLAALGWDPGSLPGLAAKINDQDDMEWKSTSERSSDAPTSRTSWRSSPQRKREVKPCVSRRSRSRISLWLRFRRRFSL
jgi:hypothetical protein